MLKKTLITLLLIISSGACVAFTGYQVELIVISHIDNNGLSAEQWPILLNKNIDLTNSHEINTASKDLEPVKKEKFSLIEEQKKINSVPHYKTLLHLAWRESLYQAALPTVMHIYGGCLYDDYGNLMASPNDPLAAYSPEQNWQVNGTVTISLNRYFDTVFNLLFTIPRNNYPILAAQDPRKAVFTYIRLNQKRRTKSKELNYIDHPLYGILFKITPVNS